MSQASRTCKRCEKHLPVSAYELSNKRNGALRRTCKACRQKQKSGQETQLDVTELTGCLQWGTSLERQAVEALARTGSLETAAASLGMSPRLLRACLSELKRRAARQGWSPSDDMTKTVPDGFHVKGVSTYYGRDGTPSGQWVKSARDQEHQLEALAEAMQRITEPFRGLAKPSNPPGEVEADTLSVYPIGDHHLGMHAWAAECGAAYDIEIAERHLLAAMDRLVDLAPPSRDAIVSPLGDFVHADSKNNTTTAGTPLDVDTRWSKVLGVGIRLLRRCIELAREKHQTVHFIPVAGNHDWHVSIMLAHCMAQFFANDPRVIVDLSPGMYKWHRFGQCLLGFTHGHLAKPDQLPGIMATDRKTDWGETEFRQFYLGHVHHKSIQEYPGCVVETLQVLPPKDAWHAAQGYRSMQSMVLDVWHHDYGQILRHSVGIRQVRELAGI